MVYAETEAKSGFQPDVIDTLEKAFVNAASNGINVKVLLIINPHNPLGKPGPNFPNNPYIKAKSSQDAATPAQPF